MSGLRRPDLYSVPMLRRDYGAPGDLRAMQHLAQRLWHPHSRPHVGDIAWGRYSVPGSEDRSRTSLWEMDGVVHAWGWAELPDYFEFVCDPAHPELAVEVVSWCESVLSGTDAACMVMEQDDARIAALEQHGYARQPEGPFFVNHVRPLDDVPTPVLPPGFAIRDVGASDVAARAEVHRRSWSEFASSMTPAAYGRVMSAWPYRGDLDLVVVSPDGEFVASALGWLDGVNSVGLVEPVGCVPEYRRRGLSAAVNLALLQAFRDAGATTAVVCPRGDDAYPVPGRLYRSIGFEPASRSYLYTRTITG